MSQDLYELRLTLDEMIVDLQFWETALPFFRRAFASHPDKVLSTFNRDLEIAEKQMRLTVHQWQLVNRKFRQATAREIKRLGSEMAKMEEAIARLEGDYRIIVPDD